MNAHDYLMTQAMTECNELAHRLGKALHFGLEQVQQAQDDRPEQNPDRKTNRERIIDEYNDLVSSMEILGFTLQVIEGPKLDAKQQKVKRYMDMARSLGTLKEE